jgi:ethanolamine utilization protein EutA
LAAAISEHRARFDLLHSQTPFALAFAWRGPPAYERIRALAEGIVKGMSDVIAQKAPVFIMLEGDVALNLGAVLRDEMQIASEVLVVDGIVLRDFDFVDIGRVRMPSYTLPVTIKSLLFGAGK